jgi:hypothetical protein
MLHRCAMNDASRPRRLVRTVLRSGATAELLQLSSVLAVRARSTAEPKRFSSGTWHSWLKTIGLGLGAWLILATCQKALADGGTIRLSETKGDYRISVFTAPNPFRAGPVEVSVLVQDAATGDPSPNVNVGLLAAPRQRPGEVRRYSATTDAATNKLFQSATFELPAPGSWNFEIDVEGAHGAAKVSFDVEAADRLPRWLSLWPWFSWPFVAVLLFAVHQAFAVNQTRFRPTPAPRRSPQPQHE